MALLPDELRARRTRRVVLSWLIGAVLLGALLVWAGGRFLPQSWQWVQERFGFAEATASSEPVPMAVTPIAVGLDAGVEPSEEGETNDLTVARSRPNARFTTEFGQVGSFREALLNAGLDPEECSEVERALRHVVDFRRCRPEHELVVQRDEQGELEHFEYHPTATEFVALNRDADGRFRAEQIRIQVERAPIAKAASVQTSIGDALTELGLPSGLAVFFTEAFEGRINFPVQARKGDVFRVIVDEERIDGKLLRYGRVHAIEYNGQRTGKVRTYFYDSEAVQGQYYDETGRAMQGGWLRTPLRYVRLSSRFNPKRFHPILKRRMPHLGVDYTAPTGTPVWAAANGRVKFAGRKGPNGKLVVLRHPGGYETYYAHLHRIRPGLRRGTTVKQRELIGFVGSTGRSTGPHLHFGLKKRGRFIDPVDQLNGPGMKMPAKALADYNEAIAVWNAKLDAIENAPALSVGADQPLVEQVDEILD